MDYLSLGKRIKEERLKLNLTQEKLAEMVDISATYLGQIERGERGITLENLVKLANKFGVTIDCLMTDSYKSTAKEEILFKELHQLFDSKTDSQKQLAVDVVKLIYSYLDKYHKK